MPRELVFYDSGANTFKAVPQSGGANDNTAASVTELNKKAAKSTQLLGTLTAAGWSGSVAPFTQTVAISGITATMNGVVALRQTNTFDQYKAAGKAIMRPTAQGIDSITVTANGVKPGVDIPIVVMVADGTGTIINGFPGSYTHDILIATISTTWNGSSPPYTQTVTVTGIRADDRLIIQPVYSTDNATAVAQKRAWGYVDKVVPGANSIVLTCFKTKPVTAIPIQIMEV